MVFPWFSHGFSHISPECHRRGLSSRSRILGCCVLLRRRIWSWASQTVAEHIGWWVKTIGNPWENRGAMMFHGIWPVVSTKRKRPHWFQGCSHSLDSVLIVLMSYYGAITRLLCWFSSNSSNSSIVLMSYYFVWHGAVVTCSRLAPPSSVLRGMLKTINSLRHGMIRVSLEDLIRLLDDSQWPTDGNNVYIYIHIYILHV